MRSASCSAARTTSGGCCRASATRARRAHRRPTSSRLADIFRAERRQLRTDPVTAARQLRALTLAVSNPTFFAGEPMTPREIVTLFLDGIRVRGRERQHGGTAE